MSTYVARPKLEEQLQTQLPVIEDPKTMTDMRTVVVWGLGGAGKSQLVRNFVHEQWQRYHEVFWVEAGQKKTIERDWIQIYKQLFLSVGSGSITVPIEDAITNVKSWLRSQEKRCLWVIDGADEIEDQESELYIDLHHYLPDALQLDRIMTTRSSRVQNMSTQKAIEVNNMEEEEAVQLFYKHANLRQNAIETEQEVKAIVKELGHLALAVMLAGSYVRETPRLHKDLRRYLERYRAQRKQFLGRKALHNVHQYHESVLSTWEISFAAIERQTPIAARLLTLLAFINFDDISLQLFDVTRLSKTLSALSDNNSQNSQWLGLMSSSVTNVDEYITEASFEVLQAYSLVSWREDKDAYVMHKLVHAWGHDRLGTEEQRVWSSAVLELLSNTAHAHEGDLATEMRLVPHIMANFTVVSSAFGPTVRMEDRDRKCMERVLDLLCRLGRWADECQMHIFPQQMTELALGEEHLDMWTGMSKLGDALSRVGKFEQAEQTLRRCLEGTERILESDHPNALRVMNNIALVLNRQGKYRQAEEMYSKTVMLLEKALGAEDPSTLVTMNNLGEALRRQGKYEQAEAVHRQTGRLMRKVHGLKNACSLLSMNNLALVLSSRGKYEQAEEIYWQTVEAMREIQGPEHPDTLTVMNNLAGVLRDQKKNINKQKICIDRY